MTKKIVLFTDALEPDLIKKIEALKNKQKESENRKFVREALHNIQYTQSLGYPVYIGLYLIKKTCVGFCTFKCQRKGTKRWGTYCTLTYIFVEKEYRNKQIAYKLAKHILTETNTTRLKALAASLGGLALFNKLGCLFWGLSEDNKGIVDTPLKKYKVNVFFDNEQPRYAKYFKGTNKPVPYKKMVKLFERANNNKN